MSDSIVRRLLSNRSASESLKESMKLFEAEADEEYKELNNDGEDKEDIPEDTDEIEDNEEKDDSTAPEQGPMPSHNSSPKFEVPDDEELEEEPQEEEKPHKKEEIDKYDNPLDNQYAVNFTLGDDIALSYKGDSQDSREGVIDGYDEEGFYRVKWGDGTTTNGLTDIALEKLVKNANECICGGSKFVNEGKSLVCDRCGRVIRENASLLLADKDRPKGKRMIRSEMHPVSTAIKPSIAESIRKALKSRGETIRESEEEDEESSVFNKLKSLDNQFWTRQSELKEDIEELGYIVEEMNSEYIVVSSEKDDENTYYIPLSGTSRTMTLDFNKARLV